MLSVSATERALASFMTSDGTQIGKRSRLDWWFALAVCSSHTFGESFLAESRAELDQCWPQTAMHVRNLALNQLTDQNVGTLANRLRSAEDLFPFRMAPAAAPDGTADNCLC
jgi:hypothetical protein